MKDFHAHCKSAAKDELTQLTSQRRVFCYHKGEGGWGIIPITDVFRNWNFLRLWAPTYHLLYYFPNVWHLIKLHLLAEWPHSSPKTHTKNFCIFTHFFAPLLHIGTQNVNLVNPALHHVLAFRPSQWLFPISVSFSPSVLNILLQSQTTDLLIHILRSCSRAW